MDAGEKPPCSTCFPGVREYNELAVKVYSQCSNQYVTAASSVSGLDLKAVQIAMDWLNIPIEDREDVWEKVQLITDSVIKECIEEAEKQAKLRGKK